MHIREGNLSAFLSTAVEGSLWPPDAMWSRGGNSNGRLIARLAQLVKAPFRANITFLMSVAEDPHLLAYYLLAGLE